MLDQAPVIKMSLSIDILNKCEEQSFLEIIFNHISKLFDRK